MKKRENSSKEGSYSDLLLCVNAEDGECNIDAPEWFDHCPGCGISFVEE